MLYDRYIKLIYNKCLLFSKSEVEAKDLTQDVFLHVFVKFHNYKEDISFKSWVYVITYNFCVNYSKRNNNKKIENKSVKINDSNELLIEVSDENLFNLKVEKLSKAMELIPADDKMLLLLKYQDGISIKELTKTLDLKESTIKMRLSRAKAKVINTYNSL